MDADFYDDARMLDTISSDLVFADWPRGINRAAILRLANGDATFTKQEQESARVKTNINDLSHPVLLHQGRTQFANGFFQNGQFMTARTDWAMGRPHMTDIWSAIAEKEANKPLIDSVEYFETFRSKFGLLVLNGIGPSAWRDRDCLLPDPLSVADLLVPTNTKLGFSNLPLFPLRKSLTAMELARLTMESKRDPGWNMELVQACLTWAEGQMKNGLDSTYYNVYQPEKWTEEKKQMAGWYLADRVPTIDVFDFYCKVEATDTEPEGWVRRIILDSWSSPGNPPTGDGPTRQDRKGLDKKNKGDFLYTSGRRPVAGSWQNIISVQYADLSAGFPAMHNSVRSLGWLAYALCHIQNRMKCRLYDSTFEALMQYFRVKNMDGVQRALKVELANMGFVDETIDFIKASERWQPNAQFIELGFGAVKQDLDSHSASWTAQPDAANSRTEKTKFQYMAELQRIGSLVSAGLNQAYKYQQSEDREIFRRLLRPNSKDPAVRRFRENCLRQGVPEKLLNSPEAWDVQHERMMGQGNQTLELMVAESILKIAQVMAPDKQQVAYRNYVTALTHNPQMALEYFPVQQTKNTPAAEQARNDFATLLQGIPVPPVAENVNQVQYVAELLKQLLQRCQQREKAGGMVKPDELKGLALAAKCLQDNLKVMGKSKAMQPIVKKFAQALGQAANLIKAFGQRLQEAAKKAQQQQAKQNGGDGGKTKATVIGAITKAAIKKKEAEQKMAHKDAQFKQDMQHQALRTRADLAAKDLTTASEIRRKGMFEEPEEEDGAGG